MAADLHIHVVPIEPVHGHIYDYSKPPGQRETPVSGLVTDYVLWAFFANSMGSRSFGMRFTERERDIASALVQNTPAVWVGEVSWLKAALFEDEATYVPGPVQLVAEAINGGEQYPRLTDQLIARIGAAFDVPNATQYNIAKKQDVLDFLNQWKDNRCFTVSW